MESREEPPDFSYLSVIVHVYGRYFCTNVRCKPCLLSKSCGNVYVRYSIDCIALRYTIYGYRAPNEKLEGAPISNLLC